MTVTLGGTQSVPITAPPRACPLGTSAASIPDGGPGTTYTWTVTNGALVSGQGTPSIVFSAAPSGSVTVGVTEVRTGCTSTGSVSIPIIPGCAGPLAYFAVPPCRRIDTRLPANAPALAGGELRTFVLTNAPCTIPSAARAVSVNLTVTQPVTGGDLRIFASGLPLPTSTDINFGPNQTRANNAMVGLDASGRIDVKNDGAGSVHVIIDVNGYFQ